MNPRIDFGRVRLEDDSQRPRRYHYLGSNQAMVEVHYGGYMLFDTRNIDTMPGPVREGWAEPWNDILLRALLKDGDVYVNAGANYGYFTLLGGLHVGSGKVFSFEANPHIFKHLMRSLFYTGTINRTTMYNRAVSDTTGQELTFRFDPQYSGGGTVDWTSAGHEPAPPEDVESCVWSIHNIPKLLDERGRWVNGRGLLSEFQTTTITVDDALEGLADHIDVFQLDIEGGESRALIGAKKLIARSPDLRIIMEWFGHYAKRPDIAEPAREMWRLLVEQEKFNVFRISPGDGNPYKTPPRFDHVPTWDAFIELPHGETYLERG